MVSERKEIKPTAVKGRDAAVIIPDTESETELMKTYTRAGKHTQTHVCVHVCTHMHAHTIDVPLALWQEGLVFRSTVTSGKMFVFYRREGHLPVHKRN